MMTMTRLGFVLAVVILGLAMAPAAARAQDEAASVTGAGEATLPEGVAFYGVMLSGLQLGQGVLVAADGSAVGQFHAVLLGTSFLGQGQEIIVEGQVNAGSAGGDGTVTFSGTATLNMGDGSAPVVGVPFTVTASTGSLHLILDGASLPPAALTAGSITIE
jgi:hypothetical protein